MMAPCGNPTKASRFGAEPAAVLAHAVAAGFIASRNGSAIVAPTPFKTMRREMCFWDKYISCLRQKSAMSLEDLEQEPCGLRIRFSEHAPSHDPQWRRDLR